MINPFITSTLLLFLLAPGCVGVSVDAGDSGPEPIRIYLLAGQSNMVGYTSSEWVAENAPALFEAREDVWCYWGGRTDALAPWTGHDVGPELAFGHGVGDQVDEPVLLAKFAVGGTTLHGHWRPPSAVERAGGEIGHLYKVMMKQFHRILADPGAYCPAYEGQGYELAGFIWLQGENDCFDGMEEHYEENLRDLVADVRAATGTPLLPVGIIVINDSPVWDEAGGGGPAVRAAQRAVADEDPNAVYIETSDLDEGYHYTDGDHVTIGHRIYEAMARAPHGVARTDEAAVARAREGLDELFYPGRGPRPAAPSVHLSDLDWVRGTAGYGGPPRKDLSIEERPLSLEGEAFARGIGTHSNSELVYKLDPSWARFVAIAGIDDEVGNRDVCSVIFRVLVDGEVLAESVVMKGMERWNFDVPLPEGGSEISLEVLEADSGMNSDHADWLDAGFLNE
jgi:hypothetical protein